MGTKHIQALNYGHKAQLLSLFLLSVSRLKTFLPSAPCSLASIHHKSHVSPLIGILTAFSDLPMSKIFPVILLFFPSKNCPSIRKSAKISPEADRHKVLTAKVNIRLI